MNNFKAGIDSLTILAAKAYQTQLVIPTAATFFFLLLLLLSML